MSVIRATVAWFQETEEFHVAMSDEHGEVKPPDRIIFVQCRNVSDAVDRKKFEDDFVDKCRDAHIPPDQANDLRDNLVRHLNRLAAA